MNTVELNTKTNINSIPSGDKITPRGTRILDKNLLQREPMEFVLHQCWEFLSELRSKHTIYDEIDRAVEDDKESEVDYLYMDASTLFYAYLAMKSRM